jgi:hypothetical protein
MADIAEGVGHRAMRGQRFPGSVPSHRRWLDQPSRMTERLRLRG